MREYEQEINAAYDAVQESSQADISAPAQWTFPHTRDFVSMVVKKTMSAEGPTVGDDTDLFGLGLDR